MNFYNNLTFKPWSDGAEKNLLGSHKIEAGNDFWGSDDISQPVVEKKLLKRNFRGRYLYAEDYPVYRKDRTLVNKDYYSTLFIDIENLGGIYKKNISDISDYRITVCSIYNTGTGRQYQLKLEEFPNELAFMDTLCRLITSPQTIISGWNVGYDIDLIRDRYLYLFKKSLEFHNPVIDYMSLYRHYVTDREYSFKLGYILKKQGLPGKVEFDGSLERLYQENRPLYYEYNLRDTAALADLENKLHLFGLGKRMIDITGCLWQDLVTNSHIVNSLIYQWLDKRGMIFCNKKETQRAEYAGGFVYEPSPGIYTDLYCFDFSSLYPSLILEWNIGPDTLSETEGKITPVGTRFLEKPESFIATIESELLAERKRLKQESDNVGQWAFKILANSIYGLFGNPGFRFCNPDIARTITGCARHINQYIGHHMADSFRTIGEQNAIIAGDTDSIYINAEKLNAEDKGKHLETLINEVLVPQYAREHGISGKYLSMKNEYGKIGGIFLKEKKMYCLNIPEKGVTIKGIIKSDKVPKANELFEKATELVFSGKLTTAAELELIMLGVKKSFRLTSEWLVPYRANKRIQDYEKKEDWISGLELLQTLYAYDGDFTRGVTIQLLGAPRTARCKKPQDYHITDTVY